MKVVIQRVCSAEVNIGGERFSQIGQGMLILLGITHTDTEKDIQLLVNKIAKLRIFDDAEGVMNLPITEVGGQAMVVSQFTLHAATKKGNRPSYIAAARPEHAQPLYESFCQMLGKLLETPIQTGRFGADMQVSLVNDGPVTIIIDTEAWQ